MVVKFVFLIFALFGFKTDSFAQTVDPAQLVEQPRRPRFELGAAMGFFYLPDYPGADESHLRALPVPYFVYRGDILRAERDGGVRGRFYRSEKVELDLSFDAAFPVNSEKNKARQGMDDLDWIGEIGPRFIYHIFRDDVSRLDFYLPVRIAGSTDFRNFDNQGAVLNPEFTYRHRLSHHKLTFALNLGVTYTTRELMDYFYTVEGNDVNATRPAFQAKAGELATNLSGFMVKELPYKLTLFTGTSFNFFSNAENRRSPLLRDRDTVSYSLGLVWRFYESKEREGEYHESVPGN